MNQKEENEVYWKGFMNGFKKGKQYGFDECVEMIKKLEGCFKTIKDGALSEFLNQIKSNILKEPDSEGENLND